MKRRKLTTGEKGWLGLVAYIVAVDSVAWVNQVRDRRIDETMSVAWGRWLQHPRSRIATGLAWATISTHLFLSWPLPGEKTLKFVIQHTFRKRPRTWSYKQLAVFPTLRNSNRKEIANEL